MHCDKTIGWGFCRPVRNDGNGRRKEIERARSDPVNEYSRKKEAKIVFKKEKGERREGTWDLVGGEGKAMNT